MLVVFTSEAHGDITMFGDVAKRLLKMMGMSGVIPGAIKAGDVPAALERLKRAIEIEKDAPEEETDADNPDDEEKKEPPVSIALRAFPLIEMLTAAAKADTYVMWMEK